MNWQKTGWKVSERKRAVKYLPFLWNVSRAESTSFSRSIKRLEDRSLIETRKRMIHATWEERSKVVKIIPNRAMRFSAQRDTIRLTGKGKEIAKQVLTRGMKYRITVNKKEAVTIKK